MEGLWENEQGGRRCSFIPGYYDVTAGSLSTDRSKEAKGTTMLQALTAWAQDAAGALGWECLTSLKEAAE